MIAAVSATAALVGHRLSKIYTRTGDDGTTGLADGSRVDKCAVRVEAYGTVDETNSTIGMVLAEPGLDERVRTCLILIQHELFEAGAELSLPGYTALNDSHVLRLEQALDAINADLPPLKEFILPGGSRAAATCHLARTVCRRAERDIWRLAKDSEINSSLLSYLNRLSDYLFVAARVLARQDGGREVYWSRQPE
jgi:cob(I)alamin adenosyltransferase